MSMKPTEEQQVALEHARAGRGLRIEARAGAGKTSTLRLIADAMPSVRMLYTSFGKKNVADFKATAPRNVSTRTNHGLAYADCGAFFQNEGRLVGSLSARTLAQERGWTARMFGGLDPTTGAHFVLGAINAFCQSADPEISEIHVPCRNDPAAGNGVFAAARTLWADMSDTSATQRQPVTHDVYLKLWALSGPTLSQKVLLLDEAQDSTPLIIDVFSRQRGQLIVVGDTFQQIHAWRGAVNAMGAFNLAAKATLTQSFRFGPLVADAANVVLQSALDPEASVRGFERLDTRLMAVDNGTVVTRTNMALIGELAAAIERKQRSVIVGGTTDLSRLIESVAALQDRRKPTAPELVGFTSWEDVVLHSKTPAGKDLALLVNLVSEYTTPRLQQMVSEVPANPSDEDEASADIILTTAHKAKGREWDNVRLTDDFVGVTLDDVRGPPPPNSRWNPEQSRLLYVAVTRAQRALDLSACSAFAAHLDTLRAAAPRNALARPDHRLAIALASAKAAPAGGAQDQETGQALRCLASLEAAQRAITDAHALLLSAATPNIAPADVSALTSRVMETYKAARSLAEDWRAHKPVPPQDRETGPTP